MPTTGRITLQGGLAPGSREGLSAVGFVAQDDYLASTGYRHVASYHPASRFWSLQAIEAGGLTALSIALLAAAVWLVRRRAA